MGNDRLEGARFPRIVLPADFRMNEIRLETIDYADLNNRLSYVCRRDFYFLCRESSSREIPSFLPLPFFFYDLCKRRGSFQIPFSCNFCSQVNIELYITRMELRYGWIVFISRVKIEILDRSFFFFLLRKFVVALRVFIGVGIIYCRF